MHINKSVYSMNQGTSYPGMSNLTEESSVWVYMHFPLAYEYQKYTENRI
jgi:hypothetical protein